MATPSPFSSHDSITTTANHKYRLLSSIPHNVLSTMSVEEISKVRVPHGLDGIIELRAFGAICVADRGRLDLLIYFMETKGVRVNSFAEGEAELLAEYLDAQTKDHSTWLLPLQTALMGGHENCITYLLNRLRKEEVNTQGFLGRTALMEAVREGRLSAVKSLLGVYEADIEVVCCGGHNALCCALTAGHMDVIILLLEHARSKRGIEYFQALLKHPFRCSPDLHLLTYAIRRGSLPLLKYIARAAGLQSMLHTAMRIGGVELYAHHYAAIEGKLAILKWLFAQGMPVDLVAPTSGRTALHYACDRLEWFENSMDVVIYLVEEQHANIHISDSDGMTAEDRARGRSYHPIVEYLRKKRLGLGLAAHARARRAEKAREAAAAAAATAPSEEELLQAAAAAEEAAASLLEELEAEKAAAASVDGNDTKKKKKNKKKKGRGQGGSGGSGGGGGGGGDSGDSKAEEKNDPMNDVHVDAAVAALEGMRIAEGTTTTTAASATAATAATAPGKEEDEDSDDEAAFQDLLIEAAPDTLKCPISHSLFREAVMASDGWTYERECLEDWIATRARKGLPLTSPKLGPVMEPGFILSQATKVQVREYVEAKTKEWQEMGGGGKKGGKK